MEPQQYWKEEVSSYWDFILGWSQRSGAKEEQGKSGFEKLLLCLEEDGRIGEAGWEMIRLVTFGRT